MLIKRASDILSSEITPQGVYQSRRDFMRNAGTVALAAGFGLAAGRATAEQALAGVLNKSFVVDDKLTPIKAVTSYNNFYEFGTDKSDPAQTAQSLRTRPWTVKVEGLVNKPGIYDIENLLKLAPMEERIYRLRCVEGWSMVIPWEGYSLSTLINKVEPQGNARYVEFVTLQDREQMLGQRSPVLDWPYVEGLRMDEAMHPLTLLTFGLYGEVLPNQNGAPVRVVVPWKYGFKSAKSIVAIRFVEQQPLTSWMKAGPDEYGFYSNVNPEVDHPRWSQARERRIGEFLKRETLKFNGYGEQVASLYTGMDLRRNF